MANINPFLEAPWFSIDEDQYLVYLLKGYEIRLSNGKGCVYFLLDGELHRENGPAIIRSDGSFEYRQNDKLHRENGPAVIWDDGSVAYWQNGLRHREDGPAVIWSSGSVEYWQNDKRHREDGPAVIWSNGGFEEYWLNNGLYSKENYYKAIKALEDGKY